MPKASEVPLQKVTLNLVEGDKDLLASYYGNLGWSVAAREIIHRFCVKLREKDSQEVQSGTGKIDLDLTSLLPERKTDGDDQKPTQRS